MKIRKIFSGILALVISGGILLISDLENRIDQTEKGIVSAQSEGLNPTEKNVQEKTAVNRENPSESNITMSDTLLSVKKPEPPKKKLKLCLVHYVDSPNSENVEDGILAELKNQGMIKDKDYTMKTFNAQGDMSTLNSIAGAIAGDKWDLIFASSTPTIQLLSKKITNIPIVFSNVGDPVRAGLGESFEKHLPNLTGISTMSDFDGLVTMVIKSMPGIKIIGTIFTPGEINSVVYTEELKKAAEKHGLVLIAVPANSATEVADAALSIVNQGIQAFTQISDNLTASCCASIIKTAYNAGIPYFGFITEQVEAGAIAVLARDYFYAGVDAAKMAIEIFNGKSPADIPFQYVTKTSVTVNAEAMNHFGVKIPEKYYKK